MNFNLEPMQDDVREAVNRVLDSGTFILGPELEEFERRFARYNSVPHCVGVGNGTDAIRIALLALGVGPGDEVISPAFNVSYTALAVQAVGAKNVYVDIDPDTMLMDLNEIRRVVTSRTKVVLPVHLFGQMVDMPRLRDLANNLGLMVVEDAAQAHGAHFDGWSPGQLSEAACFSFYPTKNLGALGEAGGVVTRIPSVAQTARLLRNGGRENRYVHALPGLNSTLDEIQAAVLTTKLNRLYATTRQRTLIAERYQRELPEALRLQTVAPRAFPVWHLFVVRHRQRDLLQRFLADNGVPALVHYPLPLHQQPFAIELDQGPFPHAEQAARQCLSLPMHSGLDVEEVARVIHLVRSWC